MSELEFELVKIANAAQEKTMYFLMAAAGSGIGFAISQTKLESLAKHHILWGLALLMWAISFWAGIRWVMNANNVKGKNASHIGSLNLIKRMTPTQRIELTQLAREAFEEGTDKHQKWMNIWGRIQMYSLLSGAIIYIAWHVLRMYGLAST